MDNDNKARIAGWALALLALIAAIMLLAGLLGARVAILLGTISGLASFYAFRVLRLRELEGLRLQLREAEERHRAAIEEMKTENLQLHARVLHGQKLESLGVLAGGIAHDFNNLLMSIIGNMEVAQRKLQPGMPAWEPVESAKNVAIKASELTRQMLAYSGKGKFVVEHIDLSRLVENTMELLKVSIGKKVELECHLGKNLPQVEADVAQVMQVVMNLILNASDAIGDRQGTICISTGSMDWDSRFLDDTGLSNELPQGRYVYIEVSDTGCGMDEETRGKIFDPFFTTKFTGTGLGLAAVLGIVKGHRGAIKVSSKVGEGTVFRILLPASDRYVEPTPEKEKSLVKDWKGSGTILVIDDEALITLVAKAMLEQMGFSVITVTDGLKGIELYETHADDITAVLLDLSMPKLSGEEVFRELRKIRGDVKVILSSGFNEEDVADRFSSEGFTDFLHKPYTMVKLREKLQYLLD